MNMRRCFLLGAAALVLTGCVSSAPVAVSASLSREPIEATRPAASATVGAPTPSSTPTVSPTALAPTVVPTGTPFASGPDEFPAGVNPLSGLPVAAADLDNLELAPALVSISNFPIDTRPQAGLSYSPLVFEIYIGVGQSRFLALFYGDFPPTEFAAGEGHGADVKIGPVRSGRLPYETLRRLYHGFMIISGASKRVLPSLYHYTLLLPEDPENISSAVIPVKRLKEIAAKNASEMKEGDLSGLRFNPIPPEGGKPAASLWLAYHRLNQIFWRYQQESGVYHRFQDNIDGKTFTRSTDRLTSEPLAFENVIILFADYDFYDATLFNIDLMYITRYPALLLRDGKMVEIYWTTRNDAYEKRTGRLRPIRFIDGDGNPVALKPGQTWVQIVQLHSPVFETVESETYEQLVKTQQPGSGHWAVRFYPPAFEPLP